LGSEENRRRMLLVDGNVRNKSLLRGSGEPEIFWPLLPKLLLVAPFCLYDLGVESEFRLVNTSLHDHSSWLSQLPKLVKPICSS
jgi:hypothetical protein